MIQSYFDNESQGTRFSVYVNVRSSNGGGRVQKRKNNLKTQAEAQRVESQAFKTMSTRALAKRKCRSVLEKCCR